MGVLPSQLVMPGRGDEA